MSIINVSHLTKDYGSGRGVFDVSFEVNKGEVFGFLGPNGAGKSTTIRHLMGFSKPQSGSTKILEKETFSSYFEVLKHVGYVPGEISLPTGLNGFGVIKMIQDMQGIHNEIQTKKLRELFKLTDSDLNVETKKMSLGTKRKLAVLVAFMSDPDVLILDEPTSGLDPVMQEVFINYIKEEKARGKTILLSSHIFSEIDATCDRIAIIKDGHLVSTFIANDLKHATTKFYNIVFKTKKECKEFISINHNIASLVILDQKKEESAILISIDDMDINLLIASLANYNIVNFTVKHETLEDYFMKFYKEDKNFRGTLK